MAKSLLNNALVLLCSVLLLGGAADGATKKSTPSKRPAAKSSKPAKPAKPAKTVKTPTPAKKPAPTPTPPPLAPGELPLAAKSAILLDTKSGDVLYEKNADAIQYPASATKILTALLVIEEGDLDRRVTIQIEDTKVEPSALYFKPGEQYPRRHLLFVLLLKSANDVAIALARDNAGSVAAFAEKMNRRAEALGAMNTHFTNPHGLPDPHHFTTARDLGLIARRAMQHPLFREIVATPEIAIERGGEWLIFKNHNRLLTMVPGCIGVKTGYTRAAQQVLVSSALRAGREAISVVLHSDKPGIWNDSKTLLEHAFEKFAAPPAPAATATSEAAPPEATAGK